MRQKILDVRGTSFQRLRLTVRLLVFVSGLNFSKDCPREPRIPMYMVIGGTFGSMLMALLIYSQIRSRRPEMISVPSTRPQISFRKLIIIVLSCFLLGWFVMGKSAENSKLETRNSRPYVHTHEGETPRFFIADTGTRITFISRESLFLAGRIDHVTVFNRSRVSVLLSRVPSSVLRIPNFHYALVITHV